MLENVAGSWLTSMQGAALGPLGLADVQHDVVAGAA